MEVGVLILKSRDLSLKGQTNEFDFRIKRG